MTQKPARRTLIEQAIARGDSLDTIMATVGITETDLDTALRRMDAAANDQPVVDDPEPALLDEVLVQRLIRGDARVPRYARCPERVEAVRILAAMGLHDRDIATRIGTTANNVALLRSRNSIPPAHQKPAHGNGLSWNQIIRADARRPREQAAG